MKNLKKIESSLETIKNDIKEFYDPKIWGFLTLNGVCLDIETTQIQWIFAKYKAIDEIVMFYVDVKLSQTVPTITDIIPSAIISQREIVDMFGINIEDSQKGLYLDEDSLSTPLAGCGI